VRADGSDPGLAIVRAIAALHGAEIVPGDSIDGAGTKFPTSMPAMARSS
jgi:hypothetical protein